MASISVLLGQIKGSISSKTPLSQSIFIDVQRNPQLIATWKYELRNMDDDTISDTVKNYQLVDENVFSSALGQYVTSYLLFVRDFDPFSILVSVDLVLNYINALVVVFNNNDELNPILGDLLLSDLFYTYTLCEVCDKVLRQQGINRNNPIRSKLTVPLSRLYNNCKKAFQTNNNNYVKKGIFLKVCNLLVHIFFSIDQPLSCSTIFVNNGSNRLKLLKGSSFEKGDVIKHRYYLGRYFILLGRFDDALIQFKSCYESFPSRYTQSRNFARVTEFYIVGLLINGYRPSKALLNRLTGESRHNFSELVDFIRLGEVYRLDRFIHQNCDFFRQRSLFNLFLGVLSLIAHRNLFLRAFKAINNGSIQQNYESSVSYETFASALRVVGNEQVTNDRVEEILVSLVARKWIRGVIHSSMELVSVSKKGDVFPPTASKILTRNGYSYDYDWLDK